MACVWVVAEGESRLAKGGLRGRSAGNGEEKLTIIMGHLSRAVVQPNEVLSLVE